jgi:UPF0755 protein
MLTYGKSRKKTRLFWVFPMLLIICCAGYLVYHYYAKIYVSNTKIESSETFIYIPTGSNFQGVIDTLSANQILIDKNSFIWLSGIKKYRYNIEPGRYLLRSGMNNNELINLLRSGQQIPVKVVFNNIRTKEELSESIAQQLEFFQQELLKLLNDQDYVRQYGFNKHTINCMFIPNTYEFYWNTTAVEFCKRMHTEYKKFWTEQKKEKAKKIGLSPVEVSILASIVQAEQNNHDGEKPRIAGLYINRLKRGIRLQADPTLIFAKKDFSIKRLLNKDKKLDSPYNTYKYEGLPPGPINLPEISSINAVLNFEKHNYLYMCAKADFSGYHNFSKTLRQHNVYARRYRQALNRKRIMR